MHQPDTAPADTTAAGIAIRTIDRRPTRAPDPALVAAARLDPATSLQVFRATLDALARPGRPTRLPIVRPDLVPAALLPVLALADLEITVAVLDDRRPSVDASAVASTDWFAIVAAATGARRALSLGEADLVLAMRPPDPSEIAALRTGDALAPERGARLVVACSRIGHGSTGVELSGPGAAGGRTLHLDGPGPELFDALGLVNRDFPAGVDTWFVAPDGAIAAISRSTHITHVDVADADALEVR